MEVYTHIKKVCLFLERFPDSVKTGNYDAMAMSFIYQIGSPEAKLFKQIMPIKTQIEAEKDTVRKETLTKQLLQEADKMFPFCLKEMEVCDSVINDTHFLFSQDIEKRVTHAVGLYEAFILGHLYYSRVEYEEFIQDVAKSKAEYALDTLLKDVEKQIWKTK